MRSKYVSVLLLATSAAIISGCGAAKDAVNSVSSELKNADLVHSWERSNCDNSTLFGVSQRVQYQFSGEGVKRIVEYYTSEHCVELGATATYEGTFETKNELPSGGRELNMNFNKVVVEAHSESAKNTLNTVHACGISDWAIKQARDLTSHTGDLLCPLTKLPEVIYDIYKVEGKILYFGKGDNKTDSAKRPAEIERTVQFNKL